MPKMMEHFDTLERLVEELIVKDGASPRAVLDVIKNHIVLAYHKKTGETLEVKEL